MVSDEKEQEYPDRIDLNYQDSHYVYSQKTNEDLLVIEAKNTQTSELFTVWVRPNGMAKILSEIGKMLLSE
jgi:hypothetical protein